MAKFIEKPIEAAVLKEKGDRFNTYNVKFRLKRPIDIEVPLGYDLKPGQILGYKKIGKTYRFISLKEIAK